MERRSPVPCCPLPSPGPSSAPCARLGSLAQPGHREGLGLRRRLRAGGAGGGRTLAEDAGPLSPPSLARRCGRAGGSRLCSAALPPARPGGRCPRGFPRRQEPGLPAGCGGSLSGAVPNPPGRAPVSPALGEPPWQGLGPGDVRRSLPAPAALWLCRGAGGWVGGCSKAVCVQRRLPAQGSLGGLVRRPLVTQMGFFCGV